MIRRPPRSTLFPYTTLFRSPAIRTETRRLQRSRVPKNDLAGTIGFHFPQHGQSIRTERGETRSEEHTSELQSHSDLVCRLLLEKKKKNTKKLKTYRS